MRAPASLRSWLTGHRVADLPPPRWSAGLVAKFALDEVTLRAEVARSRARLPDPTFRRRLRSELEDALDHFEADGVLAEPRRYHRDPPPLVDPQVRDLRVGRVGFEHVRFPSGWEPTPGEPGGDRWRSYRRNATAHAWVLRHPGPPRPWILCVNGYRTGEPAGDLWAFRADHLHRHLGLNVAVAVQPLHGPRRQGRSGDRVMFAGAMNTIHTAAQSAWDVRRLLSWIREIERAPRVGVMGLSLGGFVTALVACLDPDLDLVMAGIPEADLVRGMRRNVEALLPPHYEQWGLSWLPFERVHRVVSPLAMDAVVAPEARFIFAGLVDRWVRPGNVHALWEHWDRPAVCWYQGGHLSFPMEPSVHRFVDDALRSRLMA